MATRRYKEMRLAQLRTFCEWVRRQSFSATARALDVAPSTVWQQLRALERDFGVPLLRQRGNNWETSEDGQRLLELVGPILASVDALRETFAKNRQAALQALTVVGSMGMLIEECAPAIARFRARYPNTQVTLFPWHPVENFAEALAHGVADVALSPKNRLAPDPPNIVHELLYTRKAGLVVPRGHPLASKGRVRLADIVRYPLILGVPGIFWRESLDDVFAKAGLRDKMNVVMQVDNSLLVRRYVELGLGISILPLSGNRLAWPNLCVRSLGDDYPIEEAVAYWRKGAALTPQLRCLVDLCRESLAGQY